MSNSEPTQKLLDRIDSNELAMKYLIGASERLTHKPHLVDEIRKILREVREETDLLKDRL